MDTKHNILLVQCPDQLGLVNKITKVLFEYNLNIVSNSEFVDKESKTFFMRSEFLGNINKEHIISEIKNVLNSANSVIELLVYEKQKVVILATKEHHCLGDLLLRYDGYELPIDILAVISNHIVLEKLVKRFELPFHFITHENKDRIEHESEILECIANYNPDYIVLAKYMRILSPNFVDKYPFKIINIHHSFLPAFIGANPYKQAYDRGVKIIGATAHYVNENLDEGPIIYQSTIPVNHTHSTEDLVRLGRDIEKLVLSKALDLVFSHKVMINGRKTVVFDSV